MARALDPITGVTPQQDHFAHLIALDQLNQSRAHEVAYPNAHYSPTVRAVEASKLVRVPNVALRIQQLKASAAKKYAWNLDKLVSQAETHMEIALRDHPKRGPNVSAANGALELIARATGLLVERVQVGGQVNHLHALASWSEEELRALAALRSELVPLPPRVVEAQAMVPVTEAPEPLPETPGLADDSEPPRIEL